MLHFYLYISIHARARFLGYVTVSLFSVKVAHITRIYVKFSMKMHVM